MKSRVLSIVAAAFFLGEAALPVLADDADVGAYLAARQARYNDDFSAAAQYYTQALVRDPSNPGIMESAIMAFVALGKLDKALPIARKLEADGLKSQVAQMVLVADEIKREAYDTLLARMDEDRGIGALADGLIAAWAYRGSGDMAQALARFDAIANERGLRSFALYHKALALASVGDFESAEQIFTGAADGPIQSTRVGTIAWVEILSQLERNADALAVLDETFGDDLDPELAALQVRLTAGETLSFTRVRTAQDGVAEVFFTIGQALASDSTDAYMLAYARVTEYLKPDHIGAILMSAELLDALDQYDLANAAYKRVPSEHPNFYMAELGRAETLRRAGKVDTAVEVLESLSKSNSDVPTIHISLGDIYRFQEKFEAATAAYERAIALLEARGAKQWFAYYVRGISQERMGQWPEAEADFRRALAINPEQPQVLNYLGYTLVEEETKLDEALGMIERAVAIEPDSGYIVDSLGWALYRLGRYDEAIIHMERAVELEPVDPVVNDHLGDVLWAVGRSDEARFQWRRALSFAKKDDPSPDLDPDRIRRKLEVGLDVVLQDEGAPPLSVAKDHE